MKFLIGLYRSAKLLVVLAIVCGVAFVTYELANFGRAALKPVWWFTDKIGITRSEPKKPLSERVPLQADRCRKNTFIADFNGSKSRLEADKIRVWCTIIRLEESGVDACDIFAVHMELVPPNWGRRYMKPYNYFLGRYTYVPKRRQGYVDLMASEAEQDAATSLGIRIKDQKLCPADWKAKYLIRPDSSDPFAANQTDEEKSALRKRKRQAVTGPPSEFEFFE